MLIATDTTFTSMRRRPGVGGWLLLSPLILWLVLFVIAPTAIMFVYSFCTQGEMSTVEYTFTLEHYQRVFVSEYGWIFIKSLAWAVAATAVAAAGMMIDLKFGGHVRYRLPIPATLVLPLVFAITGYSALHHYAWAETELLENQLKTLLRSLDLAAISTAICVLIGYPVAYFIGRADEKWRNILLMLVMIPFWTNFLIRTYAWIAILNKQGLLNAVLTGLDIVKEPLDMLPSYGAVLVGTVYTFLPFMILPIYGSVEKLDNSLIEAAFDLGANPFKAFAGVILPLTRPGVTAGVLLVFVPAVGMFAINDVLGGKKPPLVGNVIDSQFKSAMNIPFGSALGILLLLLFALAFFLSLRKQQN